MSLIWMGTQRRLPSCVALKVSAVDELRLSSWSLGVVSGASKGCVARVLRLAAADSRLVWCYK